MCTFQLFASVFAEQGLKTVPRHEDRHVQGHTFHACWITLYGFGVAQLVKGKEAALAASVNTPRPLLRKCEGYVYCDVKAAGSCSSQHQVLPYKHHLYLSSVTLNYTP